MEQILFVAIVGGSLLLIGLLVQLTARRAFRNVPEPDFTTLILFVGIGQVVVGAYYFAQYGWTWPGVLALSTGTLAAVYAMHLRRKTT